MDAPLGYVNTCFTPSRSRASTRTSYPFLGLLGANQEMKIFEDMVVRETMVARAVVVVGETTIEGLGLGSVRELKM